MSDSHIYQYAVCFADASGGVVEQDALKPETALQLDIEELVSNSSADDTPPSMIIVETCINSVEPTNASKQIEKVEKIEKGDKEAANEQAGCSITLGLKPNVQFQLLSTNTEKLNQSLAHTEAALAAANISTCAAAKPAGSELVMAPVLRRCADSGTQCNNLNLDCEASNSSDSMPSIGSLVCRICHNADNPEQ